MHLCFLFFWRVFYVAPCLLLHIFSTTRIASHRPPFLTWCTGRFGAVGIDIFGYGTHQVVNGQNQGRREGAEKRTWAKFPCPPFTSRQMPFLPWTFFSPYRPAHILLTGDERQVGIKCVMAFRGEGSCWTLGVSGLWWSTFPLLEFRWLGSFSLIHQSTPSCSKARCLE